MKKTIKTWLEINNGLNELSKTPMGVLPGFRVGKNIRLITGELKDFDVAKTKLVDQYAELSEDKKTKKIPTDKIEEFNAKMKILLDEEITINVSMIPLKLIEEVNVAPMIFTAAFDIFEEEEKTNAGTKPSSNPRNGAGKLRPVAGRSDNSEGE